MNTNGPNNPDLFDFPPPAGFLSLPRGEILAGTVTSYRVVDGKYGPQIEIVISVTSHNATIRWWVSTSSRRKIEDGIRWGVLRRVGDKWAVAVGASVRFLLNEKTILPITT